MDVLGTWKIKAAKKFNPETLTPEWKTVEEILADPELDESDAKSLSTVFIFGDDGWVRTGMPMPDDIPKEELDELIASGECEVTEDNYLVFEKKGWKEEDGKIMFDTGTRGTVLDEEINPWAEIQADGDELIMMTYRLARA